MSDDIEALRERLRQLESAAREYQQVERLIHFAAQGRSIDQYGGQAVLYVDPATQCIIDASSGALELLGYPRDAFIGLDFRDLESPQASSGSSRRTYVENSVEEQVYPALYRHWLGHTVAVQVNKRMLHRPTGNVLYVRLEDHSLHQQLWRELQRRDDSGFVFQQKLKILNEITSELSQIETFESLCRRTIELGITRLGFDRLGLWFHDAEHAQMVGTYGVDEQGVIRAEHDQRWSYADTYIVDFLAGKTEVSFADDEAPIYNEKSEIIQYGWHISAPLLHGDRFIGVLTADNFIHKEAMKSYEAELLRLYGITIGHLTELVRRREQVFAMRLQQARHRMLKQFIMEIGHDFRTPLSVINTNSFLIQRVPEAERKQAIAATIEAQVGYISRMLDDMGAYIALEDLVLTFRATNLSLIMESIVASFRRELTGAAIQCEIAPTNALTVPADPRYLQQAFSRIFENALQFTLPGGSIRVSFRVYPQEIGVCITDNGIGIEKEMIESIFNPLFRADQARTERRSGLGLSVAKAIIEAHRGRIVVVSSPGEGSTFEVILPQGG